MVFYEGKAIDFSFITTQCLILVGMYLIGHCASWQDNCLAVLVSQKIVKHLRDETQRKINRMSLSYLMLQTISRIAQPMYKNRQRVVGELNSIMDDSYTNHSVMQAFCCDDQIREDFDKVNDRVTRMCSSATYPANNSCMM